MRNFLSTCLILLSLCIQARSIAQDSKEVAPKWFKGNLHTHSLWSDGNNFPEMICKWYKDRGYHFLGLSDHNILSRGNKWIANSVVQSRGAKDSLAQYESVFGKKWVETRGSGKDLEVRLKPLDEFKPLFDEPDRFLMIQSEEITDHFGRLPIHINATNIQDLIKPQGGKSVRETMANNFKAIQRQASRTGTPIFAHLNHPNFGWGVTAEDMAAVQEEKFFEIYNGHPGVRQLGDKDHPSLEKMWDIANSIRIQSMNVAPLYGIATDDSHNYFGRRGSSPGRGWVMVQADRLTPAKLIRSLEKGNFYASSGVVISSIHMNQESKELSFRIEGAEGETFKTEFIGTRRDADISKLDQVGIVLKRSDSLEPSYRLKGDEMYVRAVVTSSTAHPNPSIKGQKTQAWIQPVWSLKK